MEITAFPLSADEVFAGIAAVVPPAMRPAPPVAHIEGADCWNCNCRECFDLRREASDFDGATGTDELTDLSWSVGWSGVQVAG